MSSDKNGRPSSTNVQTSLLIFEESKKEKEFLQAEITENTVEIAGSSDDQLKSLAETQEKELKLMKFKTDEKTTNWEEFTHGVSNKERKERSVSVNLTREEDDNNTQDTRSSFLANP